MYKVIKQDFKIQFVYNIFFTDNIFSLNNDILINILNSHNGPRKKVIVFIDKKITKMHVMLIPNILNYFSFFSSKIDLVCTPIKVSGGERLKNRFLYLKIFYKIIDQYKICRQSFIISIGGGSIQDFLGYLASTAHRGIRLIRIPSTVLSQDDSGVGVKNGINYKKKKNFIGCFSVPYAVINDYSLLWSLNDRDFVDGLSEAIKVALIKSNDLFYYIYDNVSNIICRDIYSTKFIIYNCAKLHADHIAKNNDPFENSSSRPLDFGHWIAHKIESLSGYKIPHGKSVAIGVLADCTYSYFTGILKKNIWKKIVYIFVKLKFKIYVKELFNFKINCNIFDGLEEFREHLGGRLTITLITDIGHKLDLHHVNIFFYKKVFIFLKKLQYIIDNYDNKK